MTRFAFVVHPIEPKDATRKYPVLRHLPDSLIEAFLSQKGPTFMSKATGIRGATGSETEGWFIACPLTPKLMMQMPVEQVYDRIIECTELAADLGADLVGLGAFTSVIGDGGITINASSSIPVTTGNSYTVATSIQGALKACELLEIDPAVSTLAVVGATGSIGKTCARMLAPSFRHTVLIGRDLGRTQAVALEIPGSEATTSVEKLRDADVIVTVTSSDSAVIEPEHLKIGAVVCDVARPRDVSLRVAAMRQDVLVIEGGVVAVPGDVDFGMNFGFPPKTAYACMSETMMLALENRPEAYTLGKNVTVAQVQETIGWAEKHGFSLAGFRSFERAVTEETIERVRQARRKPVAA